MNKRQTYSFIFKFDALIDYIKTYVKCLYITFSTEFFHFISCDRIVGHVYIMKLYSLVLSLQTI